MATMRQALKWKKKREKINLKRNETIDKTNNSRVGREQKL